MTAIAVFAACFAFGYGLCRWADWAWPRRVTAWSMDFRFAYTPPAGLDIITGDGVDKPTGVLNAVDGVTGGPAGSLRFVGAEAAALHFPTGIDYFSWPGTVRGGGPVLVPTASSPPAPPDAPGG